MLSYERQVWQFCISGQWWRVLRPEKCRRVASQTACPLLLGNVQHHILTQIKRQWNEILSSFEGKAKIRKEMRRKGVLECYF